MRFRTLSARTIAHWEDEVGLSPVHGVAITLAGNGEVERHQHGRGQIMFASSGVIAVKMQSESRIAFGRQAVWVPENVDHEVRAATSATLHNLQISRLVAPILPRHCCLIEITGLLRELILSAVEGPNYFEPGSRQERIITLIMDEFREVPLAPLYLPDPKDIRLRRICTALRENPADNRTLEEWATVAGGCSRTLARLFLKETGMTFSRWRRQVRLLEALLRLGAGQSVTSVALDCGYESPSAFIEMFRRTLGRTPGQFLS